jgi:hypothetical protein
VDYGPFRYLELLRHAPCSASAEELQMTHTTALHRLNYRLLWDKKLRIAILTVITFMALC